MIESMGKKVAAVQSNYIPWKGYFDLINMVDEFILLDDVQYTRRDWRNRNQIKTAEGPTWLSIPVKVKGKYFQPIKETTVSEPDWGTKHWKTIVHNYSQARYFKVYRDTFEAIYLDSTETFLSQINYRFIKAICEILGITTTLSWSMDYRLIEGKTERLVDLCRQAQASEYISGPSAKGYLDEGLFCQAQMRVSYIDYGDYPEYEQLFPPFEHRVSILDLIFNTGPNATQYMKSF